MATDEGGVNERDLGGRPTLYSPEYCEQVATLCCNGATDQEIADFLEIHISTFYRWAAAHTEFREAIKAGKELADERVVRSLYARAVGFEYNAVKIFMPAGAQEPVYAKYREFIPPEPGAAKTWLTNRRPDEWREKVVNEHTGKNGGPIETRDVSARDRIAARIAGVAAKNDGEDKG